MGVTVSYKGSGGSRAFNLDGVPTGDAAKALGLPKKKHFVPQTLADALKMPQPEDPIRAEKENKVKLNRLDTNPGTLEDKVLPGGGVVVSQRGVCLRGEEDSPLVTGTKLFGSVMGSKKYHTIEEIDPPGTPRHVGAQNADEDPAPNNESANVGEPYKYQVTSRIVAERDPVAKLLKFYELDKDISVSPAGRTTGVTKERRRMIVAIRDTSAAKDGAAPLPYEVRFDAELNDGDGGWKIYLPTEHLLSVKGEDVSTSDFSGVTQINGTDWYSFDEIGLADGHVWLAITIPDGDSQTDTSVEFSAQEGQSVTGSTVLNICVAEMSYTSPQAQGDPPTVEIKQSLVGALHLGGEGGGASVVPDDVSTEFIPEPPAGTQPDGDEGRLQIKGFKAGAPSDTNTVADYLMGAANLPPSGMQLLVRWTDSDGAHIAYLPIAELYQDSSGQTPTDMTVEFVADVDWYVSGTTHVLRKRLRVLNLRTGAVTDKPNTTYANGWVVAANTTPISQIIGPSQGA